MPELSAALERHRAGDPAAREAVVSACCERVVHLCRHALRTFPGVHRWEETDDIAQNVSLRLWKSLKAVTPADTAEFLGFMGVQIRRELIDMARKYAGPEGLAANHRSIGSRIYDSGFGGGTDATHEPIHLASWAEFHVAVEALPAEEKATFDLLWYEGVSQPQAAELLGVSERTVRRRWRTARARVLATLTGEPLAEEPE